MRKLLVTGLAGFIGRHCFTLLNENGYEIHATTTRPSPPEFTGVIWHPVDLLDLGTARRLVQHIRPSHLLHLAWSSGRESWHLQSSVAGTADLAWMQATIELVRAFHASGGKRLVIAGSSAEYDWSYGYCSEFKTPRVPATMYGTCKNSLFETMSAFCNSVGLSNSWARIFFLYGPYEQPTRLVAHVIRSLLRNEDAQCTHLQQVRDYLHVQDAANALVMVLNGTLVGPVNIGSGEPVRLKEIITKVGDKLGKQALIRVGALSPRENEVPFVVADVSRLKSEVGWTQEFGIDAGLDLTIDWWRRHLKLNSETGE